MRARTPTLHFWVGGLDAKNKRFTFEPPKPLQRHSHRPCLTPDERGVGGRYSGHAKRKTCAWTRPRRLPEPGLVPAKEAVRTALRRGAAHPCISNLVRSVTIMTRGDVCIGTAWSPAPREGVAVHGRPRWSDVPAASTGSWGIWHKGGHTPNVSLCSRLPWCGCLPPPPPPPRYRRDCMYTGDTRLSLSHTHTHTYESGRGCS